jgi:hypothetical protein
MRSFRAPAVRMLRVSKPGRRGNSPANACRRVPAWRAAWSEARGVMTEPPPCGRGLLRHCPGTSRRTGARPRPSVHGETVWRSERSEPALDIGFGNCRRLLCALATIVRGCVGRRRTSVPLRFVVPDVSPANATVVDGRAWSMNGRRGEMGEWHKLADGSTCSPASTSGPGTTSRNGAAERRSGDTFSCCSIHRYRWNSSTVGRLVACLVQVRETRAPSVRHEPLPTGSGCK